MTDDELAAVIAAVANATNPREAYLDAERRLIEDLKATPLNRGDTQAEREANHADTQRRIAQAQALSKAGRDRGLSHEEMVTLSYAARGEESPYRPTDPERVGRLAHMLSAAVEKHCREHNLLIAETIMAAQIAVVMLSRNCECHNCKCGEQAFERASKEIKSGIGTAALKLAYLCEEAALEAAGEAK
jgi:hypothetical protein